jgi:hypothetical protein
METLKDVFALIGLLLVVSLSAFCLYAAISSIQAGWKEAKLEKAGSHPGPAPARGHGTILSDLVAVLAVVEGWDEKKIEMGNRIAYEASDMYYGTITVDVLMKRLAEADIDPTFFER